MASCELFLPATMQINTKIKKRNGNIVEFDNQKIKTAISKAAEASGDKIENGLLQTISQEVITDLELKFFNQDIIPNVEDVQNFVEKKLMEKGFFRTAKHYIIYRYEHFKTREEHRQQIQQKLDNNQLYVIKKNGNKQLFSIEKIKKFILNFTQNNQSQIDIDSIARQTQKEVFEGIDTKKIQETIILATRAKIEQEPSYSTLATKILSDSIYKEVIQINRKTENLEQKHQQAFINYIKKAVKLKILDVRMLLFDLEKLAKIINIERDELFEYMGLQTLYDRYLIRNPQNNILLETPQFFWMRVAMGLAIEENNQDQKAEEFYNIISTLHYVPSTPTLFHAGTIHPQLSSCYLTTVEDSLEHIFKSIGDNAQLSKWSGGIGNDWTNIRGMGALIKGTRVESQGVIPFLKIANDTTVAINRSDRRRGATCAYLEAWHYDFEDFLELRRNTGDERRRTHDMNTAAWIPDLFMKRIAEDKDWTFFSPDEVPDLHHIYGQQFEQQYEHYEKLAEQGKMKLFKKIKAKELWRKMLTMLFETGHPWITFKDPCNLRSPQDHVGVIHNSNLCTEITLNTSVEETAVCNLGSINLARHISNGQLDKEKLQSTIDTAIRMLDNVIDINFYPTKEAKFANLKHRPIGLGIMGYQDALYQMNINFDSDKAIEFADQSMEFISYHAILGSSKLAEEKGAYKTFPNSKWARGILPHDTITLLEKERGQEIPINKSQTLNWEYVRQEIMAKGMRNSNCMAIAPTATISNIAGCLPSIEPIYKNIYVKSNMSGEFTIVNQYLIEDLKKINLWNEEMLNQIKKNDGDISNIEFIPKDLRTKYKETFSIDAEWLIKSAAHRGKWIDQSQSLNIYLKTTSGKRISEVYQYAWKLGLKTTYYLRTLAASGIEKSTLEIKQQNITSKDNIQVANVSDKIKAQASSQDTLTKQQQFAESSSVKLCKINDPECEACQ